MDHLLDMKPFDPSPPPSYELKLEPQQKTSGNTSAYKMKHLLHAFILKHAGRLAGALGGARSVLLDLLDVKTGLIARHSVRLRRKIRRKKTKKPCGGGSSGGAMRLSLLPATATPLSSSSGSTATVEPFGAGGLAYYDSSWNTVIPTAGEHGQLRPISGYLEWAGEDDGDDEDDEEEGCSEIDRLAEKFIARCHERFMLEKQQSYRRRLQEMLARSL